MSKLLNEEQFRRMTTWKLTGETSCAKCKFLYFRDVGYSNYTVEETQVHCALNRDANIPKEGVALPYNWTYGDAKDNWPATQSSRCERYEAIGPYYVHLDVDGENYPDEFIGTDLEAVAAIEEHSGRKRPPPDIIPPYPDLP